MEPVDILLLEEGDPNSAFRTQNVPGDKARKVLVDRGDALVLRAAMVSVTHGQFTANGDGATLLIFEFNFQALKSSRRFTRGKITLIFEDASGNVKNRPEVSAIAPDGTFAINKTTSMQDVHQSFTAGIKGDVGIGGGAELGYVWEKAQVKEVEHATFLVGVKRLFSDFGNDNGVIWSMEEDSEKKQGIPTFLRAGVLLRRRDDVPFRFTINVDTGVDIGGKIQRLLGFEKPDPIDAVELDDSMDLERLGITSLDHETVDLTNMGVIDLGEHAEVLVATLLKVPS